MFYRDGNGTKNGNATSYFSPGRNCNGTSYFIKSGERNATSYFEKATILTTGVTYMP